MNRKEYLVSYRAGHKEERKAYRASHREQINAYERTYYASHREQHLASVLKYSQKHKDKIRAYYAEHKEELKKRARGRYYNNRQKWITGVRAWQARHRDEILAYEREWRNNLNNKMKELILKHGKCDKCGFSDVRALEVHHVLGRKSPIYDEQRAQKLLGGQYRDIMNILDEKVAYQILCANCHTILHNPRKFSVPERMEICPITKA